MKTRVFLFLSAMLVCLYSRTASGQITVYESAVLGPWVNGWYDIEDRQFIGCRFHLPTETLLTGVGGNLFKRSYHDGSIFAVVVRLDSLTAMPAPRGSGPFISTNIVAVTLGTVRSENSADYVFPISGTLAPGDYALVFGSGLFGDPHTTPFSFAMGMPIANRDVPGASYIVWESLNGDWRGETAGVHGVRFAVYGIPRHPPVPNVRVIPAINSCPGYYCDPHGTTFWVIAPKAGGTTVVLDASVSYDPDNDPLSFRWATLDEGERFFAEGVRTTNVWSESTRFSLHVSDGRATTTATFDVSLLTPADAARSLIDAMDKLEIDEGIYIRGRNSLDVMLATAAHSLEQGDAIRALHFMQLFQKRIAAQTDALGAIQARDLMGIAQAVIDAVNGAP